MSVPIKAVKACVPVHGGGGGGYGEGLTGGHNGLMCDLTPLQLVIFFCNFCHLYWIIYKF